MSCRGLTKRYGPLFAVRDLDLDVPQGATYGLIGPNGAGKTTTMSIIASLLLPDGRAACGSAGVDPVRDPVTVRRRLGYMPDTLGVYDATTVDGVPRVLRRRLPRARASSGRACSTACSSSSTSAASATPRSTRCRGA